MVITNSYGSPLINPGGGQTLAEFRRQHSSNIAANRHIGAYCNNYNENTPTTSPTVLRRSSSLSSFSPQRRSFGLEALSSLHSANITEQPLNSMWLGSRRRTYKAQQQERTQGNVNSERSSTTASVRCSVVNDEEKLPMVPKLDNGNGHREAKLYGTNETKQQQERNYLNGNRPNDSRNVTSAGKTPKKGFHSASSRDSSDCVETVRHFFHQIPAIAVACLLNLMLAIPFGVAYFPIGWRSTSDNSEAIDEDGISGTFPLPGKESLGIRMCMFSTLMGQLVMTFTSKFTNPICFQMVENVPFFHALAVIAISQQGYGIEALSTLFFMFGFSTVIVGIVFYLLGRLELGRIVYFFPDHVLVGCIGGIGVFIVITAIEVTINQTFTLNMDGIRTFIQHFHLFGIVLFFEAFLRVLAKLTFDKKHHRPKYPLLAPVFFCLITPIFYLALALLRMDMDDAQEAGYFFPQPEAADGQCDDGDCGGVVQEMWWGSMIFDKHAFDLFRIVDFRTISWTAVLNSLSTMIALTAFSLIHVPINIPAFAISTDVDTDMNAELIAHGYSNTLSGIFGGLPNYMTYSVSVLYAKSDGDGRASSLAVTFLTFVFFLIGPEIATYIPRCMAGTLLLHVGLDLFLEGVYDSYGSYDRYEYAGIWLITIVMTTKGMTAALIAGIIVALTTYAAQSITHLNPIHATMNASTLRSSFWTRCASSSAILEDSETGRSKIFVIQLQGHLFFGNIAQLIDTIKDLISEKEGTNQKPLIVIIDFTLVMGMDSSAAHAVAKLKSSLHKQFDVEVTIFVTGRNSGFPCDFALSQALSSTTEDEGQLEEHDASVMDWNDIVGDSTAGFTMDTTDSDEEEQNFIASVQGKDAEGCFSPRGSIFVASNSKSLRASQALRYCQLPANRVCESLDDALCFAEDILVARANPILFQQDNRIASSFDSSENVASTLEDEKNLAFHYLKNLCKHPDSDETINGIHTLFSFFVREEYVQNQILWKQNAKSDCAKLLVRGTLTAYNNMMESSGTGEGNYDGCNCVSETVQRGIMVGELGLVHGTKRLSTLVCSSETAILYSLSLDSWNTLVNENPGVARLLDAIVIRCLAHRVQHVGNRIFDLGGLPI